jgi:predicted MFS family arabinose efflux permease
MNKTSNIILIVLFQLAASEANANRLAEAANRGSSMVLNLAQTTSGIGIALGAILLSLGIAQIGSERSNRRCSGSLCYFRRACNC